MTMKTTKPLLLTVTLLTMVIAISTSTVFADHADTGDSWSEDEQEFYCHSNLSSLDITTSVTDSTCDIIGDAASDWTAVANSNWELTESQTSEIDFKSANLGTSGLVGQMNHFAFWGTIWTANVEFNTEVTLFARHGTLEFLTLSAATIGILFAIFTTARSRFLLVVFDDRIFPSDRQ